jgi:predicted DCC family thiol-disulfide oxidoreductase YuxK
MTEYMRRNHGGKLEFVNIAAPDFTGAEYGISRDDFMYQLHAIDRNGSVFRGVEAFRAIWLAFPDSFRYRFLETLVTLPGVGLIARAAYRTFASMRKYLPLRQSAVCRIGRRPPADPSS